MSPLKSPGADGLHAIFYQSQWDIVGHSVYNMVASLFNGASMDPALNRTLISLIPKTGEPQSLRDFCPISLCNVAYKIVTKVIANRLKSVMPILVQPSQTSFIGGRNITDNIIIAQEVVHSMRRKTGKRGWLAIKVDLEKAFDRINWSFIEDTLRDAKILDRLITLIMKCIHTPSMQVIWNGKITEAFHPSRGVRQGDPLSPYIFVLCMERLSQAITAEVNNGNWSPIRMGRNSPPLSHLFFADDLVLFSNTSLEQVNNIKRILDEFCSSSGHCASKAKTHIFFSKNIPHHEASAICDSLGFKRTDHLGNYLGVPLLHKRVTRDTYSYIIDRVQQKLSRWKANSLSLAGRITLAKSVLNTIPYYAMQTTKLPSGCCSKIDQIIRNFVWGSNDTHRHTSLVKWTDVCQPLRNGGCGIKNLEGQNHAFIAKLAFKLATEKELLWVRVLKAKYGWSDSNWGSFRKVNASHIWRSISVVWEDTIANIDFQISHNDDVTAIWIPTANGQFSVASAYIANQEHTWNNYEAKWELAWKWPGAQRIRSFLWLVLKGRLMTNVERFRRHLTQDKICSLCNDGEEDIDHILRRCPIAVSSWCKLIPPSNHNNFFHMPFNDWLQSNLAKRGNSEQWRLTFGVLCWKLWNLRNGRLFNAESCCNHEGLILSVNTIVTHTLKARGVLRFF